MQTSVAHERLRAATRDAHRHLEDELDSIEQLASIEGRRRLAPRYLSLQLYADALLERWPVEGSGSDAPDRRRADRIRADLRALGVAPTAPPEPPPVSTAAQALGFLYVVEGSTLGGRLILREIAARGADLTGLAFLDPYGARTGAAWRGFLDLLDREVGTAPDRLAEAEQGAIAGFAYARACLCGEGP